MKLRLVLLSSLLAMAAFAADVSGKWAADMPGRGGNTQKVTIDLKADGDKLSGSISNPRGETAITDGKVSGDTVTFTITREMQGNTVKMNYTGKLAGDEMKFTVVREGGQGQPREFTAKRLTT
ncbi:MAG: hypothetical protein M3Y27_16630 [Acidobacteriota bacterium]|nr:hypothetical protein [Acidobacteriota bacterium]